MAAGDIARQPKLRHNMLSFHIATLLLINAIAAECCPA
jgi:hypothetical protein